MATPTPSAFFASDRGRGLLSRLDRSRVPAHVAIIMDGNGRWAAGRGLPRVAGHRAGAKAIEEAIASAIECGVRYLTIYSFSTENWRRPQDEVSALMGLFVEVLKGKMSDLMDQRVRVRVIGRLEEMPPATARAFREAMVADRVQRRPRPGGRAELRGAYGDRGRSPRAREYVAAGKLDPAAIDEAVLSPPTCTRRVCPIRTCSSAPAGSSASPTSCCGRSPTPSCM